LGKDARSVVIAVDASERSLDALTLGRLLEDLKAAPVVLMRFSTTRSPTPRTT
jgi:hypothetical protein